MNGIQSYSTDDLLDMAKYHVGVMERQIEHLTEERTQAERALCQFQDSIWSAFDRWSKQLGWDVAGHNPQCLKLMDETVQKLADFEREWIKMAHEDGMGNSAKNPCNPPLTAPRQE